MKRYEKTKAITMKLVALMSCGKKESFGETFFVCRTQTWNILPVELNRIKLFRFFFHRSLTFHIRFSLLNYQILLLHVSNGWRTWQKANTGTTSKKLTNSHKYFEFQRCSHEHSHIEKELNGVRARARNSDWIGLLWLSKFNGRIEKLPIASLCSVAADVM